MSHHPAPEAEPLFRAAPLPIAPLDEEGRIACLRLIRSENVGPTTFRALINQRGGARRAIEMLPELSRRAGRSRPLRIATREDAVRELDAARAAGVAIVFTIEPGYPRLLAMLDPPPPLIYMRGRTALASAPTVAIVGAREASSAGMSFAASLAADLGSAGVTVVSGLARGIDRAAHVAALRTGTVGVLASGLDVVYPPEHADLQARIGVEGCLVSEQGLGFRPRAQDFPRRNRIVSGISSGIVVVEAAKRSGSLITARMAGEQGREVMAVPGHPLDPRAEGVNHLLKEGATLVTGVDDVLAAIGLDRHGVPVGFAGIGGRGLGERGQGERGNAGPMADEVPAALSLLAADMPRSEAHREHVLRLLGTSAITIDTLIRTSGLSPAEVMAALVELELAGQLESMGAQLVARRA